MKRRDALRELLNPPPATSTPTGEPSSADPTGSPVAEPAAPSTLKRKEPIKSGALRGMGLTLKQMSADADDARVLRAQIESGQQVVELDPALVDPSFVADRISVDHDPGFDAFVRGIEEAGQQVPILVRPHPDAPERYQAAYGHRRLRAASALRRNVRAIVRHLTDIELVVAQGKENSERRDLSFIERATFAVHLEEKGFERSTIMTALGVDKADLSRLVALGKAVPADAIRAIGPAPKIGRPRWTQLADALAGRPDSTEIVAGTINSDAFASADSDTRFNLVLSALRTRDRRNDRDYWRDGRGQPVVRIERSTGATRLAVDERLAAGFGDFLVERLPALHEEFTRSASEQASPRPQDTRRRGNPPRRTGSNRGGAGPG